MGLKYQNQAQIATRRSKDRPVLLTRYATPLMLAHIEERRLEVREPWTDVLTAGANARY